MNHQQLPTNLRPFLTGIAGGSASGKHFLGKSIKQSFKSFNVTIISLNNYYKNLSPTQLQNSSHRRLDKTQKVELCSVIIFEGILAFYDMRIRNLMDLKIFIETDSDVRLARRIYRDVEKNKYSLNEIINRYHTHVKPSYETFIGPTKKYADIIIPGGIENKHAINLVSEYMKKQVLKLIKCERESLFTSVNEIVDPKYQFFDNKILVTTKDSDVDYLKEVFLQTLSNEVNETQAGEIRQRLVEMLPEIFINYLKRKPYYNEQLPQFDVIITENDDVSAINDVKKYKNILFFKTSILSEEDMNIPEQILTLNPNCNLIINCIFLAPKFGELILGVRLNCVMLNTLYFSDFFIKFERFLINNNTTYNKNELCVLFTKQFQDIFISSTPSILVNYLFIYLFTLYPTRLQTQYTPSHIQPTMTNHNLKLQLHHHYNPQTM